MHKYYLRYQPVVHNHMGGCLRTKGKEGTAEENTGDGMRVGIYYGANPRIQGRVAGEKTLLSAIIMTVIVWSSDVCLETTHSRTRRPHSLTRPRVLATLVERDLRRRLSDLPAADVVAAPCYSWTVAEVGHREREQLANPMTSLRRVRSRDHFDKSQRSVLKRCAKG